MVSFNWLTLGANLLAEFVYFRREAWLISHLDDNDAAPYNQLPTFINEHHKLVEGLRAHNKLARSTAVAVLAMCTFNLVISCALLLTPPGAGGRFNGVRTLVGLVSNTLLLARRVVQNARISNLSLREDLGLSLFQMKVRNTLQRATHQAILLTFGAARSFGRSTTWGPSARRSWSRQRGACAFGNGRIARLYRLMGLPADAPAALHLQGSRGAPGGGAAAPRDAHVVQLVGGGAVWPQLEAQGQLWHGGWRG